MPDGSKAAELSGFEDRLRAPNETTSLLRASHRVSNLCPQDLPGPPWGVVPLSADERYIPPDQQFYLGGRGGT